MPSSEIRILSVGTALPGEPVDTAMLAKAFRMDALWQQWVDTFIETRTRHLATDLGTGEQYCSLADLATSAAERALAASGTSVDDIDLVVMGTAMPDMLMPATVNVVADRLGVNDVPTYQLQSGCSGAVQAIELAHDLLSTGRYRTALVIGGEVTAKHFDLKRDLRALPPGQLVNLVLFGDGAGAAVLSRDADSGAAAIRRVFTRLTGLGRESGQSLEWYGAADRGGERNPASENYKMIEDSVPGMAVEILEELLDDLGWKRADIDYLLPPQLSGRMTPRIVERLAVPGAEEVSVVDVTGNTGNSLPFLQLEKAFAEMAPGERGLCVAVESSKWIKAGLVFERI
ncbi:3-oxoacyl-ACP synthase III family protein [Streptomyces sp. NPDC096080]|uniref:3-oxoacyl-ACP synthase III family protein n=1 Tax=unclassified Streptomyces TaxID=2593676 RepID=UPI003330AAAE